MDPHIDPKLMANLWDKYVTRSQANESLKHMVTMLRNGGFSSSNRFISPFYHNQIQYEIYRAGKSIDQIHYGQTLCYKATE